MKKMAPIYSEFYILNIPSSTTSLFYDFWHALIFQHLYISSGSTFYLEFLNLFFKQITDVAEVLSIGGRLFHMDP